ALTFQVGTDRVAVDVRRVREVVPRVRVTPASGGPAWLAGVFVYRGRVVPVVDLYQLTGSGDCPPHLSSRVILVPRPNDPDELVGLLATQVADIRDLPDSPARPADGPLLGPPVADGSSVLRLLDPDRLLAALDSDPGRAPRPGTGP
ncbi:MAG TPA: chemotaxis protein CheW, partial [Urbifossiella sp.]|nr:chemotaxis protein CheW [Urbifossiella sp.]